MSYHRFTSRSGRHRAAALAAAGVMALTAGVSALAVMSPAHAETATLGQLAVAKGRYFGSATDNPELSDAALQADPGQ